jgi:hypothetical protein
MIPRVSLNCSPTFALPRTSLIWARWRRVSASVAIPRLPGASGQANHSDSRRCFLLVEATGTPSFDRLHVLRPEVSSTGSFYSTGCEKSRQAPNSMDSSSHLLRVGLVLSLVPSSEDSPTCTSRITTHRPRSRWHGADTATGCPPMASLSRRFFAGRSGLSTPSASSSHPGSAFGDP